jgi:hypothetical protein
LPYSFAVVRGDPPALFVAENLDVLHRVLAFQVVAQIPGSIFGPRAQSVREALLDERWADAVLAWIEFTKTAIDVYDLGPDLYTADDVEGELSGLGLQFTPLFLETEQDPT